MTQSPTSQDPAALFAEALARHQRGDLAGAERGYREVLAVAPAHFDAQQNQGILFGQLGRFQDSEAAFRRALDIVPGAPNALFNLALTLQNLGRYDAAVDLYRQLIFGGGPSADLWLNLGNAYRAAGHPADAEAAYRSAIQLAPNDKAPLLNLADLLRKEGRLVAPIPYLQRALELDPAMIGARRLLATFYQLNGDIDRAVADRELIVRIAPDREDMLRELILDLNLADGDDGSRVAAACREWHRRFVTPLIAERRKPDNSPDPGRRLRVGIIGGNQLRYHTLRDVMLPVVCLHDRTAFELFAYSDLPPESEDGATAEYRRHTVWRQTLGMSDSQFAAAIAQDRIDVIIDPVGFVSGSRMLALARRPAPVQISFPLMGTCGGDTIDYVIADERTLPLDAERHFTERVIRLPFGYCQGIDPRWLPPVGPLPARLAADGAVTFGSMNSLPKLSPRLLRLWGRIMAQVPASRLLIKASFPFRDADVRKDMTDRLAAAGIPAGRVQLLPPTATQAEHLAVYNRIDIALDSLPYVGVTTTFEELSMGVPVVTRVGRRVLERYGLSILKAVGFDEGIAWDDDGYVARAVDLASDLDRLERLRHSLRERLLASPACNVPSVVASLEAAIRAAWRDWCMQTAPGNH